MADRKILLLGSGYVAGPCVEYLSRRPRTKSPSVSRRIENAKALAAQFPGASAISVDVNNEQSIDEAVSQHDLVISLIPYIHHATVIKSAVKFKKNVVTTSYVSPAMLAYDEQAKSAGITVMNEIGLDPGIDHLYAVKTIDEVHKEGGKILSFLSFCGGLPAPEASNNPLGYKFSWSSRGVLLALRNNAKFYENGQVVDIPGPELMDSAKPLYIYPAFAFEGYANRDSTPYKERYNIPEAQTIIRGTLRYQGFPKFVKALVDIGFLDDSEQDYLKPEAQDVTWRSVLAKLIGVTDASADLEAAIKAKISEKDETEIQRILNGMKWLDLFSNKNVTKRGTYLDTLCATLEEKMAYEEGERDMIMLQHKFEVELADGTRQTRTSTLLEYGEPNGPSAMAKTVGIPCAIAVDLILDGVLKEKGVIAPMTPEINNPIMEALEKEGIQVIEAIL
ncbi:saccharopine dehydrogenase [Basidiobolus meristosporus CBS 931.73]|uniref:Saccharopine dehydrogenase [NADP(+), L-glutamate-forming] n=1 Tax=Basidiobolus meristosporus CBS 931.73 TaxID=1314790 RepID=A0A1Y1VW11_9FUNG|nr:saccharopine dehydrogenase [Basidiobolus meristosporus CBS 931.73]|eukprot:ORX65393.1 saccharopine dehydrogenase [Basidiobolus meristosporus CBS 931.73]